jgi:hypothetical protein
MKTVTKGQILKDKNDNDRVKVLEILGDIVFISTCHDHERVRSYYTLKEINDRFELPEEKWIPKDGETYYIPDIGTPDLFFSAAWTNDKYDDLRMSRGIVFKTKEEAIAIAKEILGIKE